MARPPCCHDGHTSRDMFSFVTYELFAAVQDLAVAIQAQHLGCTCATDLVVMAYIVMAHSTLDVPAP